MCALTSGLVGCSDPNSETVARYKDQLLYRGELLHHLPAGITGADSTRLAQAYIERWLREQYIAEVASDSLPGLEARIAYQLADYRRKLIQLELEQFVLDRYLDTTVTVAEAQAHYEAHIEDFRARDYHYQVRFLEVPVAADQAAFRAALAADDSTKAGFEASLPSPHRLLWSQWVKPDSVEAWKASAPPAIAAAFARANGPVLRWETTQSAQQARYYQLRAVVRPGEVLPLSAVATDLYHRIVEERRYELLQRYQTKFAQELENQTDVQVY